MSHRTAFVMLSSPAGTTMGPRLTIRLYQVPTLRTPWLLDACLCQKLAFSESSVLSGLRAHRTRKESGDEP